jgi:hypothetical protein
MLPNLNDGFFSSLSVIRLEFGGIEQRVATLGEPETSKDK